MKQSIWHDTPRFRLTSWGNGLALELTEKASQRSVFTQGEEAAQFAEELNALASGSPSLSYDDALGVMWQDYALDVWGFGSVLAGWES